MNKGKLGLTRAYRDGKGLIRRDCGRSPLDRVGFEAVPRPIGLSRAKNQLPRWSTIFNFNPVRSGKCPSGMGLLEYGRFARVWEVC